MRVAGGLTDRPAEYGTNVEDVRVGHRARRIPFQTLQSNSAWDSVYNRFIVGRSTLRAARVGTLFVYEEEDLPIAIPGGQAIDIRCEYNRNVGDNDPAYNQPRSIIEWRIPTIRIANDNTPPANPSIGQGRSNFAVSDMWLSPWPPEGIATGRVQTGIQINVEGDIHSPIVTFQEQNSAYATLRIDNTRSNRNYYLYKLQVGGRFAWHKSAYEFQLADEDSIAKYGERIWKYPIEFLLFKTDEDRLGPLAIAEETRRYLEWLKQIYSQPQVSVKARIIPTTGRISDFLYQVQLGEMVEVTSADYDYVRNYHSLEMIEWDIVRDGDATFDLSLTPLYQSAPWACVGAVGGRVGTGTLVVGS